MSDVAAGHDEIASAIVTGQYKVMGAVAIKLASKALGRDVADSTPVTVTGVGVDDIERLIKEYSSITGPLGVRMCFSAAQPALKKHPDVEVPSFKAFG